MIATQVKFIETLPPAGDYCAVAFDDRGRRIEVGVSKTLLSIWNVQDTEKIRTALLRQFGPLAIVKMDLDGNTEDRRIYQTYDFTDSAGNVSTYEKVIERMMDQIIEMEK